jgi:MFS family permease
MMHFLNKLSPDIKQYSLITGNYWAFTLTDGALRMLVVLYFHQLGYSPLGIAFIFLFYELFGIVTNLVGGWLGARMGLNATMNLGLGLQLIALAMLLAPSLSMVWIMAAQALSGIAKDLNKMSAKSAIKLLVPDEQQGTLYRWVALLTGSKNTLKGIGFFMGGALLTTLGFQGAILAMTTALLVVWVFSLFFLKKELGKTEAKPQFRQLFAKDRAINFLSAARCFLFGSRDIWFVIALPVYLSLQLHWPHWQVGGFLALWVIGYGVVQAFAPLLTGKITGGNTLFLWGCPLALVPLLIAVGIYADFFSTYILIVGLVLFGILFAINSSIHSFLIVSLSKRDQVSLDVGFYYMANAAGRLIGTLLSGWLFQTQGLLLCLLFSSLFILIASLLSLSIDQKK